MIMMLGAGLAACGGGGDNDDGDSGLAVPAADISTPAAARTHVGTLVQMIQALDTLQQVAGGATPASQGTVTTQSIPAAESCSNGGTVDSVGPTTKTVGSPYTRKPMSVEGIRFANCEESLGSSGSSGPTTITLNGSSESGMTEDGAYVVSYLSVGASRAEPLSLISTINTEAPLVPLTGEISLQLYLRDDFREHSSNDTEEGQFLFNIDGHYSFAGSEPNGPGRSTGEFRYYLGKAGAPFSFNGDSEGVRIEGEYGFAHVGDFNSPSENCQTGAVTVATVEPLQDGQNLFSAGQLTLSAGGNSATVTFNNNDTLTIVSGSSSDIVGYQDLMIESANCAGIGLSALDRLGQVGNAR